MKSLSLIFLVCEDSISCSLAGVAMVILAGTPLSNELFFFFLGGVDANTHT